MGSVRCVCFGQVLACAVHRQRTCLPVCGGAFCAGMRSQCADPSAPAPQCTARNLFAVAVYFLLLLCSHSLFDPTLLTNDFGAQALWVAAYRQTTRTGLCFSHHEFLHGALLTAFLYSISLGVFACVCVCVSPLSEARKKTLAGVKETRDPGQGGLLMGGGGCRLQRRSGSHREADPPGGSSAAPRLDL